MIEIAVNSAEDEKVEEYGWADLPITILQDIYELLPLKNMGRCSQVCYNWLEAFDSSRPWQKFQFRDNIFVRRKFTQHSGWQYHIDHWRLRFLITNAARRWRELEIVPVTNLFNLYEFIRVLMNFSEYYERHEDDKPLTGIRKFRFEWKLDIEKSDEHHSRKVYGTGGEMLHSLSSLLEHLHGLKNLSLVNLQLESFECEPFMEKILFLFSNKLDTFILKNATLYHKSFFHLGLFLNLRKLVVTPQHMDDDVIALIANLQNLQTFVLYQNEKTSEARPCSSKAWRQFKKDNQNKTRLFLIIGEKCKEHVLIQPEAPVYGIIMEHSCGQLTEELALSICDNYTETLVQFVQKGLEKSKRSNLFRLRADAAAVCIVTRCHRLSLFALRERISNATALILAYHSAAAGTKLCLRRNAMLKRNCWTVRQVEFHDVLLDQRWLRAVCKSYENTILEILKFTHDSATVMDDQRYKSSFR